MEGGGLFGNIRERLGGITGKLGNLIPRPNKDEPVPPQQPLPVPQQPLPVPPPQPPQQSPQQSPPQQPSSSSMEANQGSAKESVDYATGMIRHKNKPPNLNPPPKKENPTIYAEMNPAHIQLQKPSNTESPKYAVYNRAVKRNSLSHKTNKSSVYDVYNKPASLKSSPPLPSRQHGGRKTTRRRKQTNRRRRRSTRV